MRLHALLVLIFEILEHPVNALNLIRGEGGYRPVLLVEHKHICLAHILIRPAIQRHTHVVAVESKALHTAAIGDRFHSISIGTDSDSAKPSKTAIRTEQISELAERRSLLSTFASAHIPCVWHIP